MVARLVILLAVLAAACSGPTRYGLVVDSPAVPFKPADPDDLVEDAGDDEEEADDDAKAGAPKKPGDK